MKNQKRGWLDNVKTFGCAALMLLLIFAVPIVVVINLLFGDKGFAMAMGIYVVGSLVIGGIAFGTGFLLKRGLEKFRTKKFQFEGEQHTYLRDLESRSGIVEGVYGLVCMVLFLVGAYLELPRFGTLCWIMGLGILLPVFTHAIVAAELAPEIKDLIMDNESTNPNDGKGENRVRNYHLLILVTNSLLTVIAVFIILLLGKK